MLQWYNNFVSYFDKHCRWIQSHNLFAERHNALLAAPIPPPAPYCQSHQNRSKNRFQDVLPGEETIVTLENGAYINADYVNGRKLFGVPFTYIATQAPMQNTINDFWLMVWENEVNFIVMLTAEIEMGVLKCDRYWPDKGRTMNLRDGSMFVQNLEETVQAEGVFRTLRLYQGNQVRYVRHLVYTAWPPGGTPYTSIGILDIILEIGKFTESVTSPIVVHCGGGVGRTAMFITLHVALSLFQTQQPFDLDQIIASIRRCRRGSLQRLDHFEFTYKATMECLARLLSMFKSSLNQTQQVVATNMNTSVQPPPQTQHYASRAPNEVSRRNSLNRSIGDLASQQPPVTTSTFRPSMEPSVQRLSVSRPTSPRNSAGMTQHQLPHHAAATPQVLLEKLNQLKSANQHHRATPCRGVVLGITGKFPYGDQQGSAVNRGSTPRPRPPPGGDPGVNVASIPIPQEGPTGVGVAKVNLGGTVSPLSAKYEDAANIPVPDQGVSVNVFRTSKPEYTLL